MQQQVNGTRIKKKQLSLVKKNIYLITPNQLDRSFYTYLPKLLKSNRIAYLQIRLKRTSKTKLIQEIKKIKKIVNNKTKLIINDYPDIASQLQCDGCHLGQSDPKIKIVKQKYPSLKIIGATCHNSKQLALRAIQDGCSYVAFGSFFKTKTKKVKYRANLSLLQWAYKKIKKPIVAIGGIHEKNYQSLLKSGANLIACSGFIWKNKQFDPVEALLQLK